MHWADHGVSFAQAWGYLRYPLVVAMYASRSERLLRLGGTLVGAASLIHYWLLGLVTAVLSTILSVSRVMLPAMADDTPIAHRQLWAGAYGVAFLLLALASYQGWLSLLSAGLIFASTAGFMLLRERRLRLYLFCLEFAWFAFGFLAHSDSQVLISLTVIPVMAWRLFSPRGAVA